VNRRDIKSHSWIRIRPRFALVSELRVTPSQSPHSHGTNTFQRALQGGLGTSISSNWVRVAFHLPNI